MPRPERDIDSSSGPLAAFAVELRKLRAEAGSPKYLQMARRTGRSRTALAEAAGGDHLPTWETVQAYVRACGGDPALWLPRWEEVAEQIRSVRPVTAAGEVASLAGATPADGLVPGGGSVLAPTTSAVSSYQFSRGARVPAILAAAAAVVVTLIAVALVRPFGGTAETPAARMYALRGPAGPVAVSFARFSPRILAAARSSGQVTIMNTGSGRLDRVIDLHDPGATPMVVDPLNPDLLATGGVGGLLRLWHIPDGRPVWARPVPGSGAITQLAYDPGTRFMLVTARGASLAMWNTDTGTRVRIFPTSRPVTAVAFDPLTLNTLAAADQGGTVRIWDSSNGRLVRALQGHLGTVTTLAFDPLTRNTLATGERGGALRIWDSSTGRPVRTVRCAVPVEALAFNPSIRNSLASANSDGTVRIWDSSTGLPAHTLPTGRARITSLAYATDGQSLAAGSDDGTVTIWPVEDWH